MVRRFFLLFSLLGFAAPVNAQSIYLKCNSPLDNGRDFFVWLTINPGQEFGSARTINLMGVEKSVRATQVITATQYILETPYVEGLKMIYEVDRTNGEFSRVFDMKNLRKSAPHYGTCEKDAPARTMF